jgi:hypothetical protein
MNFVPAISKSLSLYRTNFFIMVRKFIGSVIGILFITNVFVFSQDVYLFSYFKGNGEDGLHLAYSYNGRQWFTLRNDSSFLKPAIGGKLMRDPSVLLASDGTFHMVWTTGWWNNGFGYASSKDLINWSGQKYIEPLKHEPTTRNNWAPEILYNDKKKEYIIYWSSWIPGRYPQTDSMGHVLSSDPEKPKMSHRIYATFTKDFVNFTPGRLFYEPGFNVIDAAIIKKGKQYIMFCKDETLTPPQKNIRIATSKKAEGPYSAASAPITGKYWVEGPSPFFVGDTCFVYFDKYRDKKYGAIISTDLKNWTDISDEISYPKGLRHGTVFKVPKSVLDNLLKN